MSISLQTNVTSLTAQQNLNVNTANEGTTVNQLTSGFRINSSGLTPLGWLSRINTRPTSGS